jgi:hypothetical protein
VIDVIANLEITDELALNENHCLYVLIKRDTSQSRGCDISTSQNCTIVSQISARSHLSPRLPFPVSAAVMSTAAS